MALPSNRFLKAINIAPLPRLQDWQWDATLHGGLGGIKRLSSPPGSSEVGYVDPFQNILGWGNLERTAGQRDGFISPATKTSVVRLWADWFEIQNEGPESWEGHRLQALDEQIWAANQAGLKVILCTRAYPPWANKAGAIAPNGKWVAVEPDRGDDDAANRILDLQNWRDRYFASMSAADFAAGPAVAFTAARDAQRAVGGSRMRFRFPGDIGAPDNRHLELFRAGTGGAPDGLWYRWIEFLAERYHPGGSVKTIASAPDNAHGAKIDVLEPVNEPNGPEGWPMHGTRPTTIVAARIVAEMLMSTKTILEKANGRNSARRVRPLQAAGPAVSDLKKGGRGSVAAQRADVFVVDMIKYFPANFPNNKYFIFSCHNYKDWELERNRRPGNTWQNGRINMAAWMVRFMHTGPGKLATGRKPAWTGWTGWPNAQRSTSCLIITEGGVRLGQTSRKGANIDENAQSAFISRGLEAMRDKPVGDYVRLVTQFLTWDAEPAPNEPLFPSALLRRNPGGTDLKGYSSPPTAAQYASAQRPAFLKWAAFSEKSKSD